MEWRDTTGGLTARDLGAFTGGLRLADIGSRAAIEDDSVRALGHTLVELFGEWRLGSIGLVTTLENLFDVEWNEAQFATTSLLPGEPLEGITELHFTPGARRAVQLGVHYRF